MTTIEPGHFLFSMINSAEDISLLLETYNVCTADEILRDSLKYDHRHLLVSSTAKREAMCKKKLPLNFNKAGLDYDPSSVSYYTMEDMKIFIAETLSRLKSGEIGEEGQDPSKEKTVVTEVTEEVVKGGIASEVKEVVQPAKGPLVEVSDEKTDLSKEEEESIEEVTTEQPKPEPLSNAGLCRYGVPKLEVEYIRPNVLGLEESLFVEVSEEDIKKFFNLVKGRVLRNIKNGR